MLCKAVNITANWSRVLPKIACFATLVVGISGTSLGSTGANCSLNAQEAIATVQEEVPTPTPRQRQMTQSEIDAEIARLYGKGVSKYFDGVLGEAIANLDQAVAMGTTDPRVFYYRGFSYYNLGEQDKAKENFQIGASMEVNGTPQYYPINRSIERIQGAPRQLLEEVRDAARKDFEARVIAYRAARYERLKRAEEWVLRKPVERLMQVPSPALDSVPNLPFPKTKTDNN